MTFTVAAAKLGAGWPWEGICVEALSVCGPSTCPSAGCTRRRGLFWGLRETDLVGLEMIPGGWAFGIRGRIGRIGFSGETFSDSEKIRGMLVHRGEGFGLGWFLGDYGEIRKGEGVSGAKKEAPLSSVVSGASGNFSLFQGSQRRHWKPVRFGCDLRFWTLKPGR